LGSRSCYNSYVVFRKNYFIDANNSVKSTQTVFNSVNRAINILICLSKGLDTVNGIAQQCDLKLPTTHRLLKTLERSNMVVYDSIKHRYYLGPLVNQLASDPVSAHKVLIACANDEMERLAEVSEETITLNVAIGDQGILLHEIQSTHVLRVAFNTNIVGMLTPSGATPKVLLSQYKDEDVEAILKRLNHYALSDSQHLSKEQFISELRLIRQQGYVIHYGEKTEGALAVSAPIHNYLFPTCISIVGYGNRATAKISILVEEIKKSASRISEQLQEYLKNNNFSGY
jgi:DNA-binding IclR family transcriptional regulator